MKKDNTPTSLKVFVILVIVGIVASMIDGIAFHFHIRSRGVGFFGSVPWSVQWSYLKTFPGNLLTALWLGSWAFAFLWLYIGDKIDDIRLKKNLKKRLLGCE